MPLGTPATAATRCPLPLRVFSAAAAPPPLRRPLPPAAPPPRRLLPPPRRRRRRRRRAAALPPLRRRSAAAAPPLRCAAALRRRPRTPPPRCCMVRTARTRRRWNLKTRRPGWSDECCLCMFVQVPCSGAAESRGACALSRASLEGLGRHCNCKAGRAQREQRLWSRYAPAAWRPRCRSWPRRRARSSRAAWSPVEDAALGC